jgi:NAD(P)-dependent dehydrogenase (short-subunit alcohol dehydrogenase family)
MIVAMDDPRAHWSPPDLSECVACVSGASYGVGRGIAEVLGLCGATVYVTARSTRVAPSKRRGWTVEDTAALVDQHGGTGIAVRVDHTSERDVVELFDEVERRHGRLDLLVNSVWQWGPAETYTVPTSQQPVERWDAMFGVGVRALFVTVAKALPLLLSGAGLVVATQERPGDHERFGDNIAVDAAAVTMSRMIAFLGQELRETPVDAVMVYLGWARTVNLGMGFDYEAHGMTRSDLDRLTQSAYLVGRAIAHLVSDDSRASYSGRTIYAGDLALRYGFTDVDGRVPDYEGKDMLDND